MSFDILILKPTRRVRSLDELTDDDAVAPLASQSEIRARCDSLFHDIQWSSGSSGLFVAGEAYALEFLIPDEPEPSSLHLALRFGNAWNDVVQESFGAFMEQMYRLWQWQAFAVSDNSALVAID